MLCRETNLAVLIINQVRQQIGGMTSSWQGPVYTTVGGDAVRYACISRLFMDRGKFIGGLEKDFPTKFYVNRPDIKVPGGESFDDYFKTFTDTIQKYRNLSDSEAILSHADGIKTLKSMENSYGEFDPKVYTHDDTTSAAEKQWQNIRQFDNGGEVKEVEEEESKEPEVDLNNTHKLIQSLIDNNIIDMICPTA